MAGVRSKPVLMNYFGLGFTGAGATIALKIVAKGKEGQ